MKRRAMVMVAALALAGGACGGDDDADVTDGASATSDGASATSDGASATSDGASATSDASDDEGDSGDDGSGGGEWCDTARNVEAQLDTFDDVDFTDPESLEDAFQQMIDRVEDAADSAPDEIQDDLELIVDGFEERFEALQDVDFDFVELDQSVLENPEVDAASDRLEAYNERECGIESDTDDDITDDTDAADGTGDSDSGDDDTLSGEGTIRDEMVRQFTAMGMTEDQADCLVDNIDLEEVASSGAADPSMFFDLFETCDIDLAGLQPDG